MSRFLWAIDSIRDGEYGMSILHFASNTERSFWRDCACLAFVIVMAVLGVAPCIAAEPSTASLITIDRLFETKDFDSEDGPAIRWLKGGGYVVLEKEDGKDGRKQLVRYSVRPLAEAATASASAAATETKEVLVPAHLFIPPGESAPLSIEDYAMSDDGSKVLIYTNSKKVWRQKTRGDYWVLDIAARHLRQLGGADARPASLMFAEMSPDGTRVCYVRENNLYVQDLSTLEATPLTRDGAERIINGTFDWVYEEELDLRKGFRWSPDSRSIAYWQTDSTGVRTFHLINDTDDLYPRVTAIPYPKAGETNSAVRVGVVSASGGPTRWLDVPGDPRNHYIARMDWAESSDEILLQQFNRLQNTNRVFLADARTGKARNILTETDGAWVENDNEARWIEKGARFVWLSDRDGWCRAYLVSRSGEKVAPVTKEAVDVMGIAGVDEKNGWLYYYASPENAAQRYLYRASFDGARNERVTSATQAGTHDYSLAPDGHLAVHTYSTFMRPPVSEIVSLPDPKTIRRLVENKKLIEKIDALKKPSSEFFRIDIGDNVQLDGWVIKPPDFDANRKYPALFHVYGEPTGQTVLDRWGRRGHLWHWMLAQQGYLIVSVDSRGTPAPRGREWRKCVYRKVGIQTSADQAAAVRALAAKWPHLDPARIAVWGWSGGGYNTLNAMFRYPDLYKTGIAVAPVANRRYYDSVYEERYMGSPSDNAEGYRLASPVTFAHQLKGNLLVIHGTGDDNVHYQGTEALINELVARNKPFEMMAYPNRTHAISEGENTTRHLFALMTRYLNEKMPAR
jgi:dipeptidyl-peptidase-4